MTLETVTGPVLEPVSVDEVRERLRLDSSETESAVRQLAVSARRRVEAATGRRLITQTLRLVLDHFPPEIWLEVGPIQSVAEVRYVDESGASQVLDAAAYRVIGTGALKRIVPAYGKQWPTPRRDYDSVTIEIVAGYGDGPDAVPEDIRQAIFLIAGHERRATEAVSPEAGAEIPMGVRDILTPYRVWV